MKNAIHFFYEIKIARSNNEPWEMMHFKIILIHRIRRTPHRAEILNAIGQVRLGYYVNR